MGVLYQSRGKGHLALKPLGGVTANARVVEQSEGDSTFEPMHHVSQRPQFRGISREPGIASSQIPIQTKMMVGEANDRYEQEADRLAPLIVRQINAPGFGEQLQDSQSEMQDDVPSKQLQTVRPTLQLKGESSGGTVSPAIESAIASARGGGQLLELGLQKRFGQAMGTDFSRVRVHTDSRADALNQKFSSSAFTTYQDVFFRMGEYQPESRAGQELLAHELMHVVQQCEGGKENWHHLRMKRQRATSDVPKAKSDESLASVKEPLNKHKLNVVGEDHNESSFRRYWEKAYTYDKTGGGYWTEAEFTYKKAQKDEDVKPAYADPLYEKICDAIMQICVYLRAVRFGSEQSKKIEDISVAIQLAKLVFSLLDRVVNTEEYKNLAENRKKFITFLREKQNVILKISEMTAEEEEENEYISGDQLETDLKQIEKLRELSFKTIDYKGRDNSLEQQEYTRLLRSKSMHKAAVENYNTLGVWKIGEAHVTDILDKLKVTLIPYNLVHLEEFNKGLGKYFQVKSPIL